MRLSRLFKGEVIEEHVLPVARAIIPDPNKSQMSPSTISPFVKEINWLNLRLRDAQGNDIQGKKANRLDIVQGENVLFRTYKLASYSFEGRYQQNYG